MNTHLFSTYWEVNQLSYSIALSIQKLYLQKTTFYSTARFDGKLIDLGITPKLRPLKWSPWGLVTCPCSLHVTGSRHGHVPLPTWYMIKVIRARADGPIKRGMTLLTTNENTGLVELWAWSLSNPIKVPWKSWTEVSHSIRVFLELQKLALL